MRQAFAVEAYLDEFFILELSRHYFTRLESGDSPELQVLFRVYPYKGSNILHKG